MGAKFKDNTERDFRDGVAVARDYAGDTPS